MFRTGHLPFDNCLKIASSNQFSPVDIFVKFKVTISRDIWCLLSNTACKDCLVCCI